MSRFDPQGCLTTLQTVQRVRGQLSGLEARISTRVDELSAAGEASQPADAHACSQRISAAEARRRERRARLLRDTPRLADALDEGEVTEDHADALASACAKASVDVRDRVLRRQRHLTDQAKRLSPDKFRKYCNRQVQNAERDEGIDRDDQQRRNTKTRSWVDAQTGMRHINGEFNPELGARIWNAVQAEVAKAIMADETTRAVDRDRLAAEALGRLVSGGHAAARPNRADISVLIDFETLLHGIHDHGVGELSDCSAVPPATVRRLACDGNIIPIVLGGDGQPLDVGRSKRFATPAQRNALRAVHETCAFPGCDVDFDGCEIHHHVLHEGGWHARLSPDRTMQVRLPGEKPPDDAIPQAGHGTPSRTRDRPAQRPPGRPPDLNHPSPNDAATAPPGRLFHLAT